MDRHAPAREALGLGDALLHAGPPIAWERMCPMRGAVKGAIQFEGWARTPADAERLAASGEIAFAPCHSRGAVGPMAGVISPGTPLLVVEDAGEQDRPPSPSWRTGRGGTSSASAPTARRRCSGLAWVRDVVAPAFQAVLEREGPIDLASLMAQALTMGDEMHMRNAAATGLLARRLAGAAGGRRVRPRATSRRSCAS